MATRRSVREIRRKKKQRPGEIRKAEQRVRWKLARGPCPGANVPRPIRIKGENGEHTDKPVKPSTETVVRRSVLTLESFESEIRTAVTSATVNHRGASEHGTNEPKQWTVNRRQWRRFVCYGGRRYWSTADVRNGRADWPTTRVTAYAIGDNNGRRDWTARAHCRQHRTLSRVRTAAAADPFTRQKRRKPKYNLPSKSKKTKVQPLNAMACSSDGDFD